MANNQRIKKIGIGIDGHKATDLNLKRNVNTTMQWGDCEPLMCEPMLVGEKIKFKPNKLVRLAPVVGPCSGDIYFKTLSMFVPYDELVPFYNAHMAGQDYNGWTPVRLPCIQQNMLACLPLIGSSCALWVEDGTYLDIQQVESLISPKYPNTLSPDYLEAHIVRTVTSPWSPTQATMHLDLNWLIRGTLNHSGSFVGVPICNANPRHFVGSDSSSFARNINPGNADLTVWFRASYNNEKRQVGLCFRYSDLGKRYYKLLRGLGYSVDISDARLVELAPLMAYWRVYFEAYGIRHWKNFESTALFKMVQGYRNSCDELNPIVSGWTNQNSAYWDFFRDLGQMWYTDPVDFVSAHQENVTEGFGLNAATRLGGPVSGIMNTGFVDVNASPFSHGGGVGGNQHLYYSKIGHGFLDEKLLKLAYKWVNRQGVIGGDIKEQLKAMGISNPDDEIPVAFIGATSMNVPVLDVTSVADTFDAASDDGKLLGEFGGKGVKYQDDQSIEWQAERPGFFVTMAMMVPDSGYCQQMDGRLFGVDRWKRYQPEFDGKGAQATTLAEIVSSPISCVKPVAAGTADSDKIQNFGSLTDTFGYIPRLTQYKIGRSCINGEFALNSKKDSYSFYHLDKMMEVGRMVTGAPQDNSGTLKVAVVDGGNMFAPSSIPKAGTWWRYNGRYKFMANFNRLFANVGKLVNNPGYGSISTWTEAYSDWVDMMFRNDDNFIVQLEMFVDAQSPVKPIALSFETFDDEKGANGEVVKA